MLAGFRVVLGQIWKTNRLSLADLVFCWTRVHILLGALFGSVTVDTLLAYLYPALILIGILSCSCASSGSHMTPHRAFLREQISLFRLVTRDTMCLIQMVLVYGRYGSLSFICPRKILSAASILTLYTRIVQAFSAVLSSDYPYTKNRVKIQWFEVFTRFTVDGPNFAKLHMQTI